MIEALIGHQRVDGLMDRNWLEGTAADAMHTIMCTTGQSLCLLPQSIAAFLRLEVQTLLTWLRLLYWLWVNPLLSHNPDRLRHTT